MDVSNKTIENLENDRWGKIPNDATNLIIKIYNLRKRKIKDLEVEDLRIMISQNVGLAFLIPAAIEKLTEDLFAEGDFYEGDLLKSVLTSDRNYWLKNQDKKKTIVELFNSHIEEFKNLDTTDNIRESLLESFDKFAMSE